MLIQPESVFLILLNIFKLCNSETWHLVVLLNKNQRIVFNRNRQNKKPLQAAQHKLAKIFHPDHDTDHAVWTIWSRELVINLVMEIVPQNIFHCANSDMILFEAELSVSVAGGAVHVKQKYFLVFKNFRICFHLAWRAGKEIVKSIKYRPFHIEIPTKNQYRMQLINTSTKSWCRRSNIVVFPCVTVFTRTDLILWS